MLASRSHIGKKVSRFRNETARCLADEATFTHAEVFCTIFGSRRRLLRRRSAVRLFSSDPRPLSSAKPAVVDGSSAREATIAFSAFDLRRGRVELC